MQWSRLPAGCEEFLLRALRVSAFLLPSRTPLPVPEALPRSLRHASTLHAPRSTSRLRLRRSVFFAFFAVGFAAAFHDGSCRFCRGLAGEAPAEPPGRSSR